MDTPAERFGRGEIHLAHSLAIDSATAGQGHAIPQLDISRASSGSARAFVNLIEELWNGDRDDPVPGRAVIVTLGVDRGGG